VGVPGFVTPHKCYGKKQLTEEEAYFNKYHQLTRSPSKRVNARLYAFNVLECRRFSRTTTRRFVRFVVLVDSMSTPPATDHTIPLQQILDGPIKMSSQTTAGAVTQPMAVRLPPVEVALPQTLRPPLSPIYCLPRGRAAVAKQCEEVAIRSRGVTVAAECVGEFCRGNFSPMGRGKKHPRGESPLK
jgi:hypothetical protein